MNKTADSGPPAFLNLFEPSDSAHVMELFTQQSCACCEPEAVLGRVQNWLQHDLQVRDPARLAAAKRRHDTATANGSAAITYCRFLLEHSGRWRAPAEEPSE